MRGSYVQKGEITETMPDGKYKIQPYESGGCVVHFIEPGLFPGLAPEEKVAFAAFDDATGIVLAKFEE